MTAAAQGTERKPLSTFDLHALNGEPLPSDALAGKLILLVNVASKCGFTKQYSGLQELQASYAGQGFTVLGVPCNQFGGQEPGSPQEIADFCNTNYGVTFPLLAKQDVNGEARSSLYDYLAESPVGAHKDIKWNFEKFLVRQDGKVVARFASEIEGDDPDLVAKIEKYLAQ
jgi:glutathione peroxidase